MLLIFLKFISKYFSKHLHLKYVLVTHYLLLNLQLGTSLVVQWIRFQAPNAVGPGSIPGQGTRSHMHAATKSSHAATKSSHSTTKEPMCRN